MSQETRFYVEKMKCAGCVSRATEVVAALPGVEASEFDLESGTAVISGDADPQAVCQALTEAGYPAVVKSD